MGCLRVPRTLQLHQQAGSCRLAPMVPGASTRAGTTITVIFQTPKPGRGTRKPTLGGPKCKLLSRQNQAQADAAGCKSPSSRAKAPVAPLQPVRVSAAPLPPQRRRHMPVHGADHARRRHVGNGADHDASTTTPPVEKALLLLPARRWTLPRTMCHNAFKRQKGNGSCSEQGV